MSQLSEKEMLEKLRGYSTPSVGNVVATYPGHPHCLGIYDPWKGNWYTDQSIHCIFPEMGRRIGYAFTMQMTVPKPGMKSLGWKELIEALWEAKNPTIVVCQQNYPPEIFNRAGLFGGQSSTLFKACGVVGVVTDGPSRDIDEIRPLDVQYIMSGVTPEHGPFAIEAVNVPVTVAGMEVSGGEIIHIDEHGACKFPTDRLADVCDHIDAFSKMEEDEAKALLKTKTLEEIEAIWSH
jgi:regulator of RNase E activity RraA